MQEMWVQSLDQDDPLEKEMATHSSILAYILSWAISRTEEPGGLQSARVGHDLWTKQQNSFPSTITVNSFILNHDTYMHRYVWFSHGKTRLSFSIYLS